MLWRRRELLPERQWHVSVKVDVIPETWCYTVTDRFAPQVSTLTLLEAVGVEHHE